jgi:RNA polymerase sigma-70 factor (ECF subfamily)
VPYIALTSAYHSLSAVRRETHASPSALEQRKLKDDLLAVLPSLRAFAISLTSDVEKADDLLHDTVVRALTHLDKFAPGTNLQAWMFTILRNQFHSSYRKRRREVEDADGQFAAKLSTAPTQDPQLDFEDLRLALAELSAEQREAVLLVGAEGFTYEEAARICRTKVGTIKSRVNRARVRLTELLGREGVAYAEPDGFVQAALGSA